jgi:hypothetical protein
MGGFFLPFPLPAAREHGASHPLSFGEGQGVNSRRKISLEMGMTI